MSENPYASPQTTPPPLDAGAIVGRRAELERIYKVASQCLLQMCSLIFLGCLMVVLGTLVTRDWVPRAVLSEVVSASFILAGVAVVGVAISLFFVAMHLMDLLSAVLYVFFFSIPGVGLLALWAVNGQATRTIRKAGFPVGALGADLNAIREAMWATSSQD